MRRLVRLAVLGLLAAGVAALARARRPGGAGPAPGGSFDAWPPVPPAPAQRNGDSR